VVGSAEDKARALTTLTEVRLAVAHALNDLPEVKQIALAGGDFGEQCKKLRVRILVGPPSEAGEARLDELLAEEGPQSVCELLYRDSTLGGVISDLAVRSHSGHKGFKQPDGSIELGTELAVDAYLCN